MENEQKSSTAMVFTQSPLVPNCSAGSSFLAMSAILSGCEPTLRIVTTGEHSPAAVQRTARGLILARAFADPPPPPPVPLPPPAGATLGCGSAVGSGSDHGTVC